MKPIFVFLVLILPFFSYSQNPLVKMWDYRYGGMEDDMISCIEKTSDGGYILGGSSYSGIGGDKTENTRDTGMNILFHSDFWVVKLDSVGHKLWDKDIGGADRDGLISLQQTRDGGYILGGNTYSGISGDKTQDCWAGSEDFWIVKLDAFGNKLWDKDFGGTAQEQFGTVIQTSDGGYLIGGESYSGISGDKTQDTVGNWDYWILKLDSLGNKLWDRDFGGTSRDYLFSFEQTSDGGYILGGWSESGIGGDKTQNTLGFKDYWILKIDSLGNKEWDRDFGGTDEDLLRSIKQTFDHGYILSGFSKSDISGDKSEHSWGDYDYWIVKIDSIGNKQWDKDLGGSNFELLFLHCIQQTPDSGYILAGTSESNISGDKTENNLGYRQAWLVKTDSLGNKLWDKTIFTTAFDMMCSGILIEDQCYIVVITSWAGIGGYKSQSAWNSVDYWIVKFCESVVPDVTFYTLNSSFCPGTCTDFQNLSFNATSYQWSFPGAIPSTSTNVNPSNICYTNPGTYDVQLIASNANGSDTLTLQNYITVFPQPPAQSITQVGDTLFAIIGSTSYQWYFNGNIINGATDYFYEATQSGDYNIVATDSNGCEVEAVINNVISDIQTPDEILISISPSPGTEKLFINSNTKIVSLKIYDVTGRDQETKVISNDIAEMDIHSLSDGIYFLQIETENGIFAKKFIKD